MDSQFLQIVAESKIVHTFTNFYMHQFVNKDKKRVAEGNCLALEWKAPQQTGVKYFLKMNNFDFCKEVTGQNFVKIRYPTSTSYLFFNEHVNNLVYAISTINSSVDLAVLEALLSKEGQVVEYQSPNLQNETKIRIDSHVDDLAENQVILNFNKSSKVAKSIGSFFGKISQKLEKQASQIEKGFHQKVTKIGKQSFAPQTHQKWNNIVAKASEFNMKVAGAIKPISQTLQGVAESVGQSYKNSNNEIIKTIRQFSNEAENSLNQGYKTEDPVKFQQDKFNDTYQQMGSISNEQPHVNLSQQVTKNEYPDI